MEKLGISTEKQVADRVLLGVTKDGASVYDRENSHFHSEGGLTPELLASALSVINTEGKAFVKECIKFDRPVGYQTCVATSPEDDICMVIRKGREGATPMVKNREPSICNSVMVIMRKLQGENIPNAYELSTAYIGDESDREPWDPGISSPEEKASAEEYWATHALIYNEDLIDKERTEKYNNMSEEERNAEILREKTFYDGLFVDPTTLYGIFKPTLARAISTPHVTTHFKPNTEQLHLGQLGTNAKITAIGYGNDGKNEGLLVHVEADSPEIQAACDQLKNPHITLSVSEDGAPKDTVNLDFQPLENPVELEGKYGLFIQGEVKHSL